MSSPLTRRGERKAREVQLRLRSLYEAARATRGAVDLMLDQLGIEMGNFRQRISVMKANGWARTADLYDPAQCGRPIRVMSLVALRRENRDAETVFEGYCRGEAAITNAVYVSGQYDYQLTSYHPTVEQALIWAEALARRPEVGQAAQRFTSVVFGHELLGLPLADPKTAAAA